MNFKGSSPKGETSTNSQERTHKSLIEENINSFKLSEGSNHQIDQNASEHFNNEKPSPKDEVVSIVKLFQGLKEDEKATFIKQIESVTSTKKRKRAHFDESLRTRAVELWRKNRNYSMTARLINQEFETKVDESYIRRYVDQGLDSKEVKQIKKKGKIVSSSGKFPELEEALLQWFKQKREKKLSLTMDMIKEEARRIFERKRSLYIENKDESLKHYGTESFTASTGWFRRFRERARISQRIATHTASTLSLDYTNEIARFLGRVRMYRRDLDFDKKDGNKFSLIANMDETPVYFDMGRKTTYHWRGEKTISVLKTTGYRKRVTVCLAVLDNGDKLPPLVIFAGKTPPFNTHKKTLVVAANQNAWITEELMLKWVREIWNKAQFPANSKPLLLLDHCTSHKKPSIGQTMKKDTSLDYVPPGCTSLVQPLDLSINKPFKDSLRKSFEDWLHTNGANEANTTKKKNLKSPTSALLLSWIDKAWANIDNKMVVNSFKVAGILIL